MGTDQRLFISDGKTGYYNMMATPSPETGSVWSPFRAIPCSCVKSIETKVGVKQLLLGPPEAASDSPPLSPPFIPTGPILCRDLTTYLDWDTGEGVPYRSFSIAGSIVLAHPSQMAELAFVTLDSKRVGSPPKVGALLDEVWGWPNCPEFKDISEFTQDPPRLPESQTIWNNRYYFNQDGDSCWCRHLMLKIDFSAEDAASEIDYMTFFAAVHKERTITK
jgi:hypothetical protein